MKMHQLKDLVDSFEDRMADVYMEDENGIHAIKAFMVAGDLLICREDFDFGVLRAVEQEF